MVSKEDGFTESRGGQPDPIDIYEYATAGMIHPDLKEKNNQPNVREIQLEQLVRKFMRATMTSAGSAIREAHADAREMGIR